tara:strand:- start:121 stop:390 length:270 start_codon:yes stop_codon:yes gene_type:complete
MNKFIEVINDMVEIITGERPKQETERAKGFTKEETQLWLDSVKDLQVKPKRARGKKGKFLADNKLTKDFNEAWVGGKAPKRKRKKNAKK